MLSKKLKAFLKMPYEDRKIIIKSYGYGFLHRYKYQYLGKGSYIDHPIRLTNSKHIVIGNYTQIRKGIRIDCITNWNGKKLVPRLNIGDGCDIGQNCTITCANNVDIEDNVVISFGSYITDCEHVNTPTNMHLFAKNLQIKDTTIGEYTFIGCNSVVLAGSHIGKNCVIGAGAVVKGDIPDNSMAVGAPAHIIKKYDEATNEWK